MQGVETSSGASPWKTSERQEPGSCATASGIAQTGQPKGVFGCFFPVNTQCALQEVEAVSIWVKCRRKKGPIHMSSNRQAPVDPEQIAFEQELATRYVLGELSEEEFLFMIS